MGKILTAGVGQQIDNHVPVIMDSDHPETNEKLAKPHGAIHGADCQWAVPACPKCLAVY